MLQLTVSGTQWSRWRSVGTKRGTCQRSSGQPKTHRGNIDDDDDDDIERDEWKPNWKYIKDLLNQKGKYGLQSYYRLCSLHKYIVDSSRFFLFTDVRRSTSLTTQHVQVCNSLADDGTCPTKIQYNAGILIIIVIRPRRSIETIASFDQWYGTIENHWKRW